MQYQGGKSRIAKEIIEVINNEVSRREEQNCTSDCASNRERESNVLVSLFCGTCSVESRAIGFDKIICNDNHEYLIAMLQGVQNGYELPDYIPEEQYRYIRDHKDEDKVLTGFVGFGCSFGGRWFEGYARNKEHTNYAARSKRSLLKDMATLAPRATFICGDYRNVEIPKGAVVYADPPYRNTKKISRQSFDNDTFWEYMREISKDHQVFISEQTAPDDFECIWEKPVTRTLDRNKSNQFKTTEKLFRLKQK